jgi:PAS domain S-box-containing protein
MSNKNSDYYFLRGGGEMGELIRAKDWSKTALGDPADWPQSLCTMVAVMLNNPFGMYIAWGSDYIQLYNDGYRPILGVTKHPQALGISTRETFSEIWHIIDSMFEDVMKGKAVGFPDFMLHLNRNGYEEACYFDFSYSPIRKDNGEVGGVFVTVIETTHKKKAEERLKKSNQHFRNIVHQAPTAMCILRGENFVVEVANEKQLELWGKTKEQVMDLPVFTAIPETVGQGFEELLNGVFTTGKPFIANETAITLIRNGKEEIIYVNFVYEPLYNDEHIIDGVLLVTTDMTEQVNARKIIKDSQEQLQTVLRQAPAAIAVLEGPVHKYTLANSAYQKMNSRSEEQMLGKTVREVFPELEGTGTFEILDNVFKTGQTFSMAEYPLMVDINNDGIMQQQYFNFTAAPIKAEGKVASVMVMVFNITEQVIARKKIEESEERLRKTTDHFELATNAAEVGTWSLNLATEIVDWSALHKKMWGYDERRSDFVYEDWHKVILTEDKEAAFAEVAKALKTKTSYEAFYRIKRSNDDEIRWMKSTGQYFYNEKDEPVTLTGVSIDITDAKEAETALRKNIQTLAVGSAVAGLAIIEIDYATNLAHLTDKAAKMYFGPDAEAQSISRLTLHQTFHPENLEKMNSLIKKSLDSDGTGLLHIDHQVIWPNGEVRWLKVSKQVFFNRKGQTSLPEYSILAAQDITNIKEAEEKLLASEERFQAAIKAVQGIIWTNNAKGEMEGEQAGWASLTGQTYEEYQEYGWAKAVHPDDVQPTVDAWNEAVQERKTFIFEHRVKTKDGQWRYFSIQAIPLINADGTLRQWVGVHTDITEQKTFTEQLEKQVEKRTAELKDKNEELEKMNKELESFAYISSHDLQEPLRKIQMLSDRILEKEENNLSEIGKDHFKRMQSAAKRMQILIQDLLAYSRTNITERTFETTDLNDIIGDIKEDLKEELKEKNAIIETNQLCFADIIPFQFRQLLHNLISNSLKFSNPANPPHIHITGEIANGKHLNNKELLSQTKYCHITVSDNGIGFEPHYNEKIFEIFKRLHVREHYHGTGIGLSIVKKIVENHNGIITAHGELNKGATFDIYFPTT